MTAPEINVWCWMKICLVFLERYFTVLSPWTLQEKSARFEHARENILHFVTAKREGEELFATEGELATNKTNI